MITYYKTIDGGLKALEAPEKGCWIHVEQPGDRDLQRLTQEFGLSPDFIQASLDENERSHIETQPGQLLLVMDMPLKESGDVKNVPPFYTLPMGFILTANYFFTITGQSVQWVENVVQQRPKGITLDTTQHTHLMFTLIYQMADKYIRHLDTIEREAFRIEKEMRRSLKNQALVQLLNLEKSLVYFTTALKSSEATLERLQKGRALTLTDDEEELLVDTLIEIKQAIETAAIYSGVLDSTMDAVASIISNNMNTVMKALTSLTIVLSVPNMVFGFYGMNVALPDGHRSYIAPMLITVAITIVATFMLYKRGFFED